MKRFILALALVLAYASVYAQKPTKEEKKAARMERRAEAERQQHIKDSLFWAKCYYEDSLYRVQMKRERATDVMVVVPMSTTAAMDRVAKALIRMSYMIDVDKEYGTIKTAPVHAGMANYTLYFTFEGTDELCTVRACAFGHGNTGIAMYGIVRTHEVTVKLEYKGSEGSVNRTAFDAIERILKGFENTELKYETIK